MKNKWHMHKHITHGTNHFKFTLVKRMKRKIRIPHLLPLKEGSERNIPHICFSLYFLHQHHQEVSQSTQNTIADGMISFVCLYFKVGMCCAAEFLYFAFFFGSDINLPGPADRFSEQFRCAALSSIIIETNERYHCIRGGILNWLGSFLIVWVWKMKRKIKMREISLTSFL